MENPIPKPSLEFALSVVKPLKAYFDPRIIGLEKIRTEKPALYVCNHTIFGLTDGIFLWSEALQQKGVQIHALIDDMHMEVPIWRDLITDLGMMPASREACAHLMKSDQHIMVFPGGTREVCKQKGEAYKLIWNTRLGFVRMAVQHGYDIIPVASIGGEETYNILWDANDIMKSPVGYFLKKSGLAEKYFKGGAHLPPIVQGVGKTGIPRPERIYIKIGDPIATRHLSAEAEGETTLTQVRDTVESVLETLFAELQIFRNNDTDEEWWRKWLKNI